MFSGVSRPISGRDQRLQVAGPVDPAVPIF
jgi:hypothetical protein